MRLFVFFLFSLLSSQLSFAQSDAAPVITVSGRQIFCPGSTINIVTDFTITDADDSGIDFFFVQISSGYQLDRDRLVLTGNHPNILTDWNPQEGKLTLFSSTGGEMLLTDLENAIRDIVFSSSTLEVSQEKTFSFTIDNANYLPSTGHFYEFVSDERITWTAARDAAQLRTFYGRQGYLATLTSQEEADFAGKQASGAGWIGGSDAENEGEWKWVTGPEAGTVFWRGAVSGTTPNFAFWNRNEPNNFTTENPTGEHYAHITDPTVPNVIIGSWNDLPNEGGTGLFIPKGYIVEYGKPGDPALSISGSSSIYIPEITSTSEIEVCESGTATVSATASEGEVVWYEIGNIGNQTPLFVGTDYTTFVNETTTVYASVRINGCANYPRTPVTIRVNERPEITSVTNDLICSGTAVLSATVSAGQINWYENENSTTPIFVGTSFQTPPLTSSKSYFVEANISGCNSLTRTEVIAEVDNNSPQFDLAESTFILCKDIGRVNLRTINAQGNYRYIWKREGNNLIGDLGEIEVTETGNYSVTAISQSGCISSEQFFSVRASEKSNITKDDIEIIDDTTNNSIRVTRTDLGIGDYEFALDDINGTYQREPFFENISTGIHTLYIKDVGGCGIQEYQFSILAYPKFFTPNGDNQNDLWQINGFNSTFYTTSNIYIYNRFGNLIYTLTQDSQGWDGSYAGKKLPENTYWFRVILTDINGYSIEKFGNISLIR